jgi:hypothetical protein
MPKNLLYVLMELKLPKITHACGPDCLCWRKAFETRKLAPPLRPRKLAAAQS